MTGPLMIKLKPEGFGYLSRALGLLVLAVLCLSARLCEAEAPTYGGYEVNFRGVAISDEGFGVFVAYGSYYCEATVKEILYDPNSSLSLGDNVTVAYQNALSVKAGDEIDMMLRHELHKQFEPKAYP
jgi:hypothetical protein